MGVEGSEPVADEEGEVLDRSSGGTPPALLLRLLLPCPAGGSFNTKEAVFGGSSGVCSGIDEEGKEGVGDERKADMVNEPRAGSAGRRAVGGSTPSCTVVEAKEGGQRGC